jgi:uncharacterized protein (DUF58 family)
MIDLSFLQKLDKLILLIRKNITSNYSGPRQSKAVGEGLLFRDYSIYSTGDDIRFVDWRVFARTEKLFIKRFEEERNLTVHILVDMSGSMSFGSHKYNKSSYASMMAIGFAYIAMKNNERFAMSTFSDKLTTYRPRRGRKQLAYMFEQMNKEKAKGVTEFEKSISSYKKMLNSKSYVVILSDFLYPTQEIQNILNKLRKHEVKLVQILDPVEAGLKVEGDFKLRDLESSQVMRTYVSPKMRKKYLAQLHSHNSLIKKMCKETNSSFYTISTKTPVFDAFYEVLTA